jgi:AcrR family transcriptional regulator
MSSPANPPLSLRARQHARKHARILAAARTLVRQGGHEHLSLREVARRARLSPAGMYEFFDTREHLVDTLAAEADAALADAMRRAAPEAPDPVERLVRLGLAYIRFAEQHPADFMLLFGRVSGRRSLGEEVSPASEYGQIRSAVAAVIGVGQPGGPNAVFLEALAYGFWSSMHGMAILRLTYLAGFDADFASAHRLVLESIARSWQRVDWAAEMARCGKAAGAGRPPEGTEPQ